MEYDLRKVCSGFQLPGAFVSSCRFGTGHINDTFKVETAGGSCVLQRINTSIFREPEKLMENFLRVTRHIGAKIDAEKRRDPACRRQTLHLCFSRDDKPFFIDGNGNFWRCYRYVGEARTYDILETPQQAFAAAAAFGGFQNDLADMEGRLNETIPAFHDTPARYAALERAVAADCCGRLKEVGPELEFIRRRSGEYDTFIRLQKEGRIVERTTHNDTKLNNVLIDDVTGAGICVIDLDTVMPGLPHYDFGDMVRTGTSPAAEDETDLSKVTMRFGMFEALLRGYLSAAGKFLNTLEKSLLPFSGKLITLEIGIRFLTDYLEGDKYFRIHREKHNLDRCRTQIRLAASIEEQLDPMRRLTDSL